MSGRAAARRERVWPLRLLQASPLLAAALLLGAWFAVPAPMRAARMGRDMPITTSAPADSLFMLDRRRDPEYEVLSAFQQSLQPNVTQSGYTSNDPEAETVNSLQMIAENNVATLLRDADGHLFTGTGDYQPYGYPNRSAAFDTLARFEATNGANVIEWLAPEAKQPHVVASYVANPALITSAQRKELETSHTIELIRAQVAGHFSDMNSFHNPGASAGGLFGKQYLTAGGSAISGGHLYQSIGIFPESAATNPGPQLPDPMTTADPSSPGFQSQVQLAAVRQSGAIFVFGPMDAPGIPIRSGRLSRTATDRLVEELWPARINAIGDGSSPVRLTDEQSRLAGGAKWVLFASATGMALANLPATAGAPLAEQRIIFAAFFNSDPRITALRKAIVTGPWRATQVRLALWLPWILSGLGAFLVATLFASPLAFVAERRLRADRALEVERERVRTAARERVLDRLASLSAHVERASEEGARRDADELDSVSRDIEGTVDELRRILGSTGSGGGLDA